LSIKKSYFNEITTAAYSMYAEEMSLKNGDCNYKATIFLLNSPSPAVYREMKEALHWKEYKYYHTFKYDKRKKSYLLSRYTAKKAFSAHIGENNLKSILIQPGVFTQPVAVYKYNRNTQVSISHCDDFGAALAFSEAAPMGIDIEMVDGEKNEVIKTQLTNSEKALLKSYYPYETMLTCLWTIKEGLSKVLKTGLTVPLNILEIQRLVTDSNCIISYFKNFGQYKAISFALGKYICSVVYPLQTEISLDIKAMKRAFDLPPV